MSVFLNLHEGAELQGLRDRSGGEQFSRMKEQLDGMNIAVPLRPRARPLLLILLQTHCRDEAE